MNIGAPFLSQKEKRPPVPELFPGAVATFVIGDECYLVCALDKLADAPNSGNGQTGDHASHVVGEFKTRNGNFAVVSTHSPIEKPDERKESQSFNLLTKRELQIVILVAEGHGNKEIANRLRISEWTVSTHLRRIFAKLHVDNRAAMVFKCAGFLHR